MIRRLPARDRRDRYADLSGPAAPPNIVVILSDDMGFSDLGCYGGEIATPNLDALAADGLRFTQFYNNARCCPSRASLLTGLYPHQAGIGHMMEDRGFDGYRGDLNARCRTIAEVLRPAGYRTYAVGKWHVTRYIAPDGPKHNWPLGRGFDRFYGTIHGAGSFYDPSSLVRDNTMISPYADPEYRPADVLLHRRHRRPGRPLRRRARAGTTSGPAVLPLRGLHGRPLADARPAGGHRQVQGQIRRRLWPDPPGPASSGRRGSG